MSYHKEEIKRRMQATVSTLSKEFSGLRTGRASTAFLDPIMVEAYGARMPLTQVGTVSVPEPRLLTVQVWDVQLVKSVEKAIRESGLGLNPSLEGQLIRIPMPELSEQRRQELSKIASKYTEQSRVAIRNIRRDGMDALKKMEKDKEISEDDHRRLSNELQTLTDDFIEQIDEMLTHKEKDIMQV